MSDLAFFKVEVTDRSGQSGNADIVGQNRGYCWEDSCSINNIQSIYILNTYILYIIYIMNILIIFIYIIYLYLYLYIY